MKNTIDIENFNKLIQTVKNDNDLLDFIFSCIKSFENYHAAIIEMETWLKLYNYGNLDKQDYQDKRQQLDRNRTLCHNTVLGNINALNRLANKYNIPNIYSGEVSEQQPYRLEVANAVLEYLETTIKKRI